MSKALDGKVERFSVLFTAVSHSYTVTCGTYRNVQYRDDSAKLLSNMTVKNYLDSRMSTV
jgi:hypothetical protein